MPDCGRSLGSRGSELKGKTLTELGADPKLAVPIGRGAIRLLATGERERPVLVVDDAGIIPAMLGMRESSGPMDGRGLE
jgi:hypothetical protein